jgi:hypothetical protein
MSAKLTDIQNVTLVVAAAAAPGNPAITPVTVTHNLVDQYGDRLTPDEVKVEIVNIGGPGAAPDECFTPRITRSSPENGTFIINGAVAVPNDVAVSVGDWTYTARVISKYFHSIQSEDHTV